MVQVDSEDQSADVVPVLQEHSDPAEIAARDQEIAVLGLWAVVLA